MITINNDIIECRYTAQDIINQARYMMSVYVKTLVDKDGNDHATEYAIKESDIPAMMLELQEVLDKIRTTIQPLTTNIPDAVSMVGDDIVIKVKDNKCANANVSRNLDFGLNNSLITGLLSGWATKVGLPDKEGRFASLYAGNLALLSAAVLRLCELAYTSDLFQ